MNRWTFGNQSLLLEAGVTSFNEQPFGVYMIRERDHSDQGDDSLGSMKSTAYKKQISNMLLRARESDTEMTKLGFLSSQDVKHFMKGLRQLAKAMEKAEKEHQEEAISLAFGVKVTWEETNQDGTQKG